MCGTGCDSPSSSEVFEALYIPYDKSATRRCLFVSSRATGTSQSPSRREGCDGALADFEIPLQSREGQ